MFVSFVPDSGFSRHPWYAYTLGNLKKYIMVVLRIDGNQNMK